MSEERWSRVDSVICMKFVMNDVYLSNVCSSNHHLIVRWWLLALGTSVTTTIPNLSYDMMKRAQVTKSTKTN